MVSSTALRVAYILQHTSANLRINEEKKRLIANIFYSGAVMFASGFVLWNLDNIFCHRLTMWKLHVDWPAAFLLEGT